MKVLDLRCPQEHAFEGWFASEQEFQSQLERGLVQCPLCSSSAVRKVLSAPRLNLCRAARPPNPVPGPADQATAEAASSGSSHLPQALQAAWLGLARHVVAHTENVGARFAEQARRMHYGEIEQRGIRGQASADEAAQLLDEGIAVLPLLLPDAAKEPLQ